RLRAQNGVALRVAEFDNILTRLIKQGGFTSAIELGCGFSTRGDRLSTLHADWTYIDLPPIVAQRDLWRASGQSIAASVTDTAWLDEIEEGPHVFVAEGLLCYLPRSEVDALLGRLRQRCPGSIVVADIVGAPDFAQLTEQTTPLGAPLQWHAAPPFNRVLETLDLVPIDGFEPDTLFKQALKRYFSRLDPADKIKTWWALNADKLSEARSGTIVGYLSEVAPL
ncbi:MAG: class I SAM-dependent methyltransferase, partial [Myxococcota bacterium]